LKADLATSTTNVRELEAELEARIGQFTADLAESHAGAASSTARIGELTAELGQFRAETENSKAVYETRIGELTTQLEQSRAETVTCQNDLQEAKKHLETSREEATSNRTEHEAIIRLLDEDLTQHRAKVATLKTDLQEVNTQRARFEADAKTYKHEAEKCKAGLDKSTARVRVLEADVELTRQQSRATSNTGQETKIRDLNKQLKEEQAKFLQAAEKSRNDLFNSTAKVDERNILNSNLTSKLEISRQEAANFRSDLATSNRELAKFKNEAKEFQKAAEKYKTQYDMLTTASSGPGAQQVNAEIVRLGNDLKAANTSLVEIGKHRDSVVERNRALEGLYSNLQDTVNPCLLKLPIHPNPLPPRSSVSRAMPYTGNKLLPKAWSFLHKTTLSGNFKR
jgi:chromosome segregation ATPase